MNAKERILGIQESDSANWRTRKCKHCGDSFKINKVTQTNINEFGWCPECYKFMFLDKLHEAD